MSWDFDIQVATAVGPILAVVVAMIAVHHTNKNSKQQIIVGKLEELFEIILTLSRHYPTFKLLFPLVKQIINQSNDEMRTYDEYKVMLDEEISETDRREILINLSRVEVLAKCYTKGKLQEEILKWGNLMYSFADFVFNAGGLQEAYLDKGFPTFTEFTRQLEDLKKEIIVQIQI